MSLEALYISFDDQYRTVLV